MLPFDQGYGTVDNAPQITCVSILGQSQSNLFISGQFFQRCIW